MEEILHHPWCMKPYEKQDILRINCCKISSIKSTYQQVVHMVIIDKGLTPTKSQQVRVT